MVRSTHSFTLDEANRLLPEIDSLFKNFIEQKDALERQHDAYLMEELLVSANTKSPGYDPGRRLEREAITIDEAVFRLVDCFENLRALGAVVRNVRQGWVDFPGQHEGRRVYFCWHRGEQNIKHYHPMDGSMTERLTLLNHHA